VPPTPNTFLKMDPSRGGIVARNSFDPIRTLTSFKTIASLQIEPMADKLLEFICGRRH
jgi:hypothetical protein